MDAVSKILLGIIAAGVWTIAVAVLRIDPLPRQGDFAQLSEKADGLEAEEARRIWRASFP